MAHDVYSRVFERAVFPLLDRLNGTSIRPKIDRLLADERLPRDEIRRRQDVKLERVVDGARRESDFYRRLWDGDAGPASAYSALGGLPVLRKDDLRAAPGAFPLPGHRGRLIRCRTSGSTGEPMTFLRGAEQESWFWALRFQIWSWAGYGPGDPYLEINFNPRTAWKKRLQDVFFRCAYLSYRADTQDSRRIVAALRERRPPFLNGFSSSLFALARHMLDEGIENPGVRGVTATGDGLYPPYREAIESAFGTRVLDYYGAGGEGVHLAAQCPQSGGRYHLLPGNAVVEIVGPEEPAAPGTTGRLLVTQLDNPTMPLIRYELGDAAVAAADDDACPCGRTLPMLERIEGRLPDLVAVPGGGFLLPHFFVVLFKTVDGVHQYQAVQRQPGHLTTRLVARPGCDREAVARTVRREVTENTGGGLEVDIEWVDEIPATAGGKRRLVISELGRQVLTGDDG